MTQYTLSFDCRPSPYSVRGQTHEITATADTLLDFITPYIEKLLKSDQIRSITLWEGRDLAMHLAEFPDEIGGLKRRLRELVAADRAESLV